MAHSDPRRSCFTSLDRAAARAIVLGEDNGPYEFTISDIRFAQGESLEELRGELERAWAELGADHEKEKAEEARYLLARLGVVRSTVAIDYALASLVMQ